MDIGVLFATDHSKDLNDYDEQHDILNCNKCVNNDDDIILFNYYPPKRKNIFKQAKDKNSLDFVFVSEKNKNCKGQQVRKFVGIIVNIEGPFDKDTHEEVEDTIHRRENIYYRLHINRSVRDNKYFGYFKSLLPNTPNINYQDLKSKKFNTKQQIANYLNCTMKTNIMEGVMYFQEKQI